jgi:hypothetical protein
MSAFNVRSFQPKSLPVPFENRSAPASSLFQRFLDQLLNILSPYEQPRIRCYTTRMGEPAWTVYDPVDRSTHHFNAEEDVRIWLEQRYYQ